MALLLAILLTACSVKENRNHCPCHLLLDVSEVSTELFDSLDVALDEGNGRAQRFPLCLSLLPPGPVAVDVAKGRLSLNVCAVENGAVWLSSIGDVMEIPQGEQCPPLFLHTALLDARVEELTETVILHKSFCSLHIQMDGTDPSQPYPFSLQVRGDVDGFDANGRPKDGLFNPYAYPTADGQCTVRVPRQKDDTLELLMCEDEVPLATFALGEYLKAGGYDWTAPDLADVSVRIDCARLTIRLKIEKWSETFHFNVEI
ncbi:MAG: hypothetical protein IJU13_02850 [Bacteroidales bacterium]|nr:hypothetical protein [Bacteroidales bacterium]